MQDWDWRYFSIALLALTQVLYDIEVKLKIMPTLTTLDILLPALLTIPCQGW